VALVVAAGFAVLANTAFMNEFFLSGRVDLSPWFAQLPWLYLVFLPAISMRGWSEERRTRTYEVLLAFPLTPLQLVLGKLAAALVVLALVLASSVPIVAMLLWLGAPDPGLVVGGYLAAFAAGALLLALGLAISCLCRDQVTAFVLSVLAAAALVLSGHERVVAVLDGLAPALAAGSLLREGLSLLPHYERLARGLVDLPALVYFAGGLALCIGANALAVARVRD
jgi:ABC-2 type transport system permease protein